MRFPPLDEAIQVDLADEVTDTFADDELPDDSGMMYRRGASRRQPRAGSSGAPGCNRGARRNSYALQRGDNRRGGRIGRWARLSRRRSIGWRRRDLDRWRRGEGGSSTVGDRFDGRPKRGQRVKKRDPHKQREREQLRSYLQPEGETDSTRERDGLSDEQRRKVDAAAVDAVFAYEERVGRTPERMPHENEGFDVRSTAADGSLRYIEVKGHRPSGIGRALHSRAVSFRRHGLGPTSSGSMSWRLASPVLIQSESRIPPTE